MISILVREHVPAGEKVWNGYIGGNAQYCIAPLEDGFYSLYEIADDNNIHVGWEWEKEGVRA